MDGRFGEGKQISEDLKQMVWFTKERQKLRRKQKFELDESDGEIELTHKGKPLEEIDDFWETI